MKTIGIVSDFHVPFQDDKAVNKAMNILKDEKPETIVVDGDLIDCWEVSKFNQVPRFGVELDQEVEAGYSILADLRKEHPRARIIFIEGNHEFRVKSYLLKNAPRMYHHNWIPERLKLKELKIEWVPVRMGAARFIDNYIVIDNIHIGHFDKALQGAGMSVRNLMMRRVGNFVQAHVHKGAVIFKRSIDKEITFGVETPALCRLDPFYSGECDWQQGISFLRHNGVVWRPELIVF